MMMNLEFIVAYVCRMSRFFERLAFFFENCASEGNCWCSVCIGSIVSAIWTAIRSKMEITSHKLLDSDLLYTFCCNVLDKKNT